MPGVLSKNTMDALHKARHVEASPVLICGLCHAAARSGLEFRQIVEKRSRSIIPCRRAIASSRPTGPAKFPTQASDCFYADNNGSSSDRPARKAPQDQSEIT